MTASRKDLAETATTPAIRSPAGADPTARADKRTGDELADKDLDQVSGGPTAVERTHSPT